MRVLCIPLAALAVSCGPPREKVVACESALNARLAAISAASAALDSAETESAARIEAADKARVAADKRVAKVTLPYKNVLSYPDELKKRIAAGKMRFVSATPGRSTNGVIKYDVELNGDYRSIGKTMNKIYEQPVAVFLDRIEVNVTDDYRKIATVKLQIWVHETPKAAVIPAVTGPSKAWTAAIAKTPVAECAEVKSKLASQVEAQRAALEARAESADRAGVVEAHENAAKERSDLADSLLSKRDDNKAAFTSRMDELVEKAKTSVAGLAELRIKANGDPDWR